MLMRSWCRPHLDRLIVINSHIKDSNTGLGVADVDLITKKAETVGIYTKEHSADAKARILWSRLDKIVGQRVLLLVDDWKHTEFYSYQEVLGCMVDRHIELFICHKGQINSFLLGHTKSLAVASWNQKLGYGIEKFDHYSEIGKWKEKHTVLEAEIPLIPEWKTIEPKTWLEKLE